MIDLHSHILYGIDDGSKSLETSLEILSIAYTGGVTDIVVTPHYIKDSKYQANNTKKLELLNNLKQELKIRNININLYLGNEVYITEGIPELIKTDISTINNSKYLLMEFPMARWPWKQFQKLCPNANDIRLWAKQVPLDPEGLTEEMIEELGGMEARVGLEFCYHNVLKLEKPAK